MGLLDIFLMAVGAVLIAFGLYLFVSGKKEGGSANHVEGFGVKVNVSNPSILLIVLGVGLLLVPRVLPEQEKNQQLPNNQVLQPTQIESTGAVSTDLPKVITDQPAAQLPPQTVPANVFLPTGMWDLTSYEENGIDLSSNASGEISFSSPSANSVNWNADIVFIDMWGNVSNFQYQGVIYANGNTHSISFTASNAPYFVPQGPVPLDLKIDRGNQLHMGYFFNNANILLHFSPE